MVIAATGSGKESAVSIRKWTGMNYAIAFYNTENGMEARNKYCKRCIGVKTYSAILMDPPRHAQRCCVFEGFFDFLSYAMFRQLQNYGICIDADCDYIVLNSVSNLHKVIPYLNYYRYIHCYLDNDKAGKKAIGPEGIHS